MDATASGAQVQSQGEMYLVSGYAARRPTALKNCFRWNWPGRTRSGESFGEKGADGEIVWS